MELIFCSAPVQFGGAGRACGAGSLPRVSGKDPAGLKLIAQVLQAWTSVRSSSYSSTLL